MSCIYALSSSFTPNTVRYVGISKYDTAGERLKKHFKAARYGVKFPIYNWIRKHISNGYEIVATVIENNLTWEEACEGEKFYIREYRNEGHPLTNMTDGGDGPLGRRHSDEARAKMRGRRAPLSAGHKAQISVIHLGKIISTETKVKMSIAATGRKHSTETKTKISAVKLGKKMSTKTRENMSTAQQNRRICEQLEAAKVKG